jgi:hypothetical protein
MRKSTIFISAVLTTFALVVLYRVAAAYNDSKNATPAAAAPTSLPAPAATEPPAVADAPAVVALGAVDAAQLAAKVVGNTNLLSSESSNYNGVNAYKITFTNNDVVYIGLDGQILSVQIAPATPPPPAVVNVVAPPAKHKNNRGNGSPVSAPGVSRSSDDHHEEHDDD